jgi:hypothetical protein
MQRDTNRPEVAITGPGKLYNPRKSPLFCTCTGAGTAARKGHRLSLGR